MAVLKNLRELSKMEFYKNGLELRKSITEWLLTDFAMKPRKKDLRIVKQQISDEDKQTIDEILERNGVNHDKAFQRVTPEWFADEVKQYLDSRTDDDPALFLSKNGHRFQDDSGVEYMLSQIGEISGVYGVRPHRLRHTFIQRCVDKGMSIQDVMHAVRHASISTTEEYYVANAQRTKEAYGRVFN